MPYLKSGAKEAVGENIRTWRKEGYPEKQAVAMALSTQRRYKGKKRKKPAESKRARVDGKE